MAQYRARSQPEILLFSAATVELEPDGSVIPAAIQAPDMGVLAFRDSWAWRAGHAVSGLVAIKGSRGGSPMRQVPGVFCSFLFILTVSPLLRRPSRPGPAPVPPPAGTTFEIAALTPDQEGQLTTWVSGMEKWQKYDEKWRNRPAHDGWGRIAARKAPPDMPSLVARALCRARRGTSHGDRRADRAGLQARRGSPRHAESVNPRRTGRRGESEAQFLPHPHPYRWPVDHDAEREPVLRHHRLTHEPG